jgi:DNA mismatch repair ATPase MutS
MIEELEDCEEILKEAISPFVRALFQRFYENRRMWQPVITNLAELDCLTSLATVSSI